MKLVTINKPEIIDRNLNPKARCLNDIEDLNALICLDISSCIASNEGTTIKTIIMPKPSPYTSVITVGFKN